MSDSSSTSGSGTAPRPDLEGLVATFERLSRRFPDLDFLDPGGRLIIDRAVPAVSCVRIELPGNTSLRLSSVLLDADGLGDPIGQLTRVASSSADAEAAVALEQGRILDADADGDGLRTRKQDRPWLELSAHAPIDLKRITVVNVDDRDAVAARGIRVLVRTADGWWITVYDGTDRERSFARFVERHFGGGRVPRRARELLHRRLGRAAERGPAPASGDLVRILTDIQLRDYGSVIKDLDRVDLEPEQVSEFRSLVNDKIVKAREQEWTVHGIQRSFRFWSEQEKRDYLGFAMDVMSCLRQLNNNVCFGFGSVLAAVRDQELIPHDDDLDVLIGFGPDQASSLHQALRLMKKCLQDEGFVVTGGYTSFRWVFPPGRQGPKLDVFVGLFEGESISWYPGKRGALTREMMFPASTRPLLGYDCPVPHDPERYLEQIYGPGWGTPDLNFRHTWDRSKYLDIAK